MAKKVLFSSKDLQNLNDKDDDKTRPKTTRHCLGGLEIRFLPLDYDVVGITMKLSDESGRTSTNFRTF